MLTINNGSHKEKNVDIIDRVMLTYSGIKSIGVLLFILYSSICIKTYGIEVVL
jgi:hypothetical protein